MNILEKLRSALTTKKTQATASYKDAVIAAATGADAKLDPAAVLRLLEDSGKSLDEFEADVSRVRDRETMRKELADAQRQTGRRQKFEADLKRLDDERKAFEEQHDAKFWPAANGLKEVERVERTVATITERLLRECADADLLAEKTENTALAGRLQRDINAKRGELDQHKQTLLTVERQIQGFGLHTPTVEDRAEATRRQGLWADRVATAKTELASLEQQLQDCHAASNDIQLRMTASPY